MYRCHGFNSKIQCNSSSTKQISIVYVKDCNGQPTTLRTLLRSTNSIISFCPLRRQRNRMTKVTSISKVSKSRRERNKRREARHMDATAVTKLNPIMISPSKSGSLKSLASLDVISTSVSSWSSRQLSSLAVSLSWKLLRPSDNESGGRGQPIEVNGSGSIPGSPVKQRTSSNFNDNSDQ